MTTANVVQALAEAESRARREGQAQMMAFQLELKRITSRPTGIPAWTIGVTAVVFLVLLGVVIALHLTLLTSYQRRLADLQANLGQIEHKSEAELWAAQAEIGQVTARATSAERLVNELRGKLAGLKDRVEQLEAAREIRRAGPLHAAGRHRGPEPDRQPAAADGQLGAAPLDDVSSPECKDPSTCAMASTTTPCSGSNPQKSSARVVVSVPRYTRL